MHSASDWLTRTFGDDPGLLTHTTTIFSRQLVEGGVISGVPVLADPFNLFLVQATIIIAICGALAVLGKVTKQPKVIFEIVGGIILGPSGLGKNTKYMNRIFPASSLISLSIIANLGLVLYLFLVGMELDPKKLKTLFPRAGGISVLGICLPFALGIAISPVMFNTLQRDDIVYGMLTFSLLFYV
jgi:Kef-type K+ transport system membrane component KefB